MPRPGLFAYKTDPQYAGMAALDWFDPDPNAAEMSAELWSGPIEPGWSHAASFTDNDGVPCVFKFNQDDQIVGIDRVRADGSGLDPCHTQQLTDARWDIIAGLQVDDRRSTRLYAYQNDGGLCWPIDVTAGGAPGIVIAEPFRMPGGWSQICVTEQDGQTRLIGYGETDNSVALVDPEAPGDAIWTERWARDWSLMAVLAEPHDGVFMYRSADGAWQLRELGPDRSIVAAEGVWRTGWSVLLPFTLDEAAHVLGYDAETGDVEVLRFYRQDWVKVVWNFRWSPGWSIQIPLLWPD